MKEFWKKNNKYILIIALIMLLFDAYNQRKAVRTLTKTVTEYKSEIIKNAKLVKQAEGQYSKTINDMVGNSKELMSILKAQNQDLFDYIQDQDKKLISVINTVQSFKDKQTVAEVTSDSSFVDFYPTKEKWFVQYTSILDANKQRLGDWKFGDISIDLAISETQAGIFEADIKGPEFLKVNKLQVSSLPLSKPKIDNFGWLTGASVNYNLLDQGLGLDVYGGIRIKKTNLLIKADTKLNVGAGIIQEF